MIKTHNLPRYLLKVRDEIEGYAKDMGLSFFDTIFQLVDYEEMSSLAAYVGFPNRYPHWKFGMAYNMQNKTYRHGMGTIFELVINNDPAYAYLLDCNNLVQQKMVMAHVFGHVDFFTNNYMFLRTDRKMMDKTANNATKVRQYSDKHGVDAVEKFLDTVLSLEDLIDITSPFRAATPKKYEEDNKLKRLPADREYMDSYMNPKMEFKKPEEDDEKKKKMLKLVTEPERDVLGFLVKHAPMTKWQRHILEIIREEAYYYAPQAQTKILNEGWATYCHEQIMTQRCLDSSEIIDFADLHSRITRSEKGKLNPYALGLALLRDVKDRWDKGKHGKEYDMCDDMEKRRNWNTHENKGAQKLLEIRKHYNDITFIDEFMTQEFVMDQKIFKTAKHEFNDHYAWIIESKQVNDIKQELLSQHENLGNPFIFVTDGNYNNKGELLLHHRWEGKMLDKRFANRTLANLENVWGRPVNIETFVVEKGKDPKAEWYRLRCENGKTTEYKTEEKDLSYKR